MSNNVKTVMGITAANVKTVNGIAAANVKTVMSETFELAVAQADSLGEIRRIDRMAQAKLRSISKAEYKADNV